MAASDITDKNLQLIGEILEGLQGGGAASFLPKFVWTDAAWGSGGTIAEMSGNNLAKSFEITSAAPSAGSVLIDVRIVWWNKTTNSYNRFGTDGTAALMQPISIDMDSATLQAEIDEFNAAIVDITDRFSFPSYGTLLEVSITDTSSVNWNFSTVLGRWSDTLDVTTNS